MKSAAAEASRRSAAGVTKVMRARSRAVSTFETADRDKLPPSFWIAEDTSLTEAKRRFSASKSLPTSELFPEKIFLIGWDSGN